jgi:formylglycine-generating enzyme required for sulfatase activity
MKTRPLFRFVAILFVALTLATPSSAQSLVTIDLVTVGDAGNAADTTTYGAVADVFDIGKYEVTIGQYNTFLNSVAAVTSDTYIVNLWNANMTSNLNIAGISRSGSGILGDPYSYSVLGSGSRPITYVSWFDAARFANWMNNGATNGASTETGAYTLNGATSGVFTKNAGATWWIPSEDEWYKAAYYKGGGTNAGYWVYPTQSDSAPGNIIGGAANQANYYSGNWAVTQSSTFSSSQNYLTDGGAFSNSASAYGTFDQGGNVREWNDGVVFGSNRGRRGSAWNLTAGALMSSSRSSANPTQEDRDVGFRLAAASAAPAPVPEPGTWAAAVLLAGAAGYVRWRRRRAA